MKKYFILNFLFFFIGINMYSQNDYIIDKKGKKIVIDENSSQMSVSGSGNTAAIDYTIYYTVNGKKGSIVFSKTEEASYGNYKIQSYNLDSKKTQPYFIIAENENYKLISFNPSDGYFFNYIVDNNGKVIENLKLENHPFSGIDLENRTRVDLKIREYFGSCEDLIKRLDRYKYNTAEFKTERKMVNMFTNRKISPDNKNLENLFYFFENPYFLTCN